MRACVLALLAVLAVVVGAHAEQSHVKELSTENFEENVMKGEWLVAFTAPWCGHCKRLAPELEKAAAKLEEDGIQVAKVDGPSNFPLMARFPVSGYPGIFSFKDGVVRQFPPGRRGEEKLLAFARNTEIEALGPMTHPFGVVSTIKSKILAAGSQVFVLKDTFQTDYGFSSLMSWLSVGALVLLALGFIIVLVVLMVPVESERPHVD